MGGRGIETAEAPEHITAIAPISSGEGLSWVKDYHNGSDSSGRASMSASAHYLSRNAVARYESGERTPTILTLATLADFLGVTVDDLAGRAKSPGACDFSERSVRADGEAAE